MGRATERVHDVPSIAYGGIDGITIPHQTYMIFQMMFAIITPALIVGAVAERMKFSAFIIFIVIWATFVYDFGAHWTWEITGPDNYGLNPGYCGFGWTGCLGLLDFAGGTVIHITSGWSGLVIALMLGRRLGYGKVPMEAHNISLVVLGGALLWTGWFGFNAGSCSLRQPQTLQVHLLQPRSLQAWAVTWSLISWAHTWKAFDCRSGLWRSSWACSYHASIWLCVPNVFHNHRHFGVSLLLLAVAFKNRREWDDAT